jgi:hypothetical protein
MRDTLSNSNAGGQLSVRFSRFLVRRLWGRHLAWAAIVIASVVLFRP